MLSQTSRAPDVEVAIVGSGFSGLGMAIQLEKAGRGGSYVVLEKAHRVGGTWRANDYPGCACDIPSDLYSFSFEPNPGWTRAFAPQAEILAYLERCARKYGVMEHIRFGADVTELRFDEAGARWHVSTRDGQTLTARFVVLGIGALSRPAYPAVEGRERFRGRAFHSAEWDHGYDLADKRVAVIGTGASAIQFVPQVAPRVRRLHLFQRTPPWVLPRPDRAVTARERRLFAALPAAQRLRRYALYWSHEARGFGFTVDPRVMKLAARMGERHIRRQIADPALRALVTPRYTPGCKRILMSDDYYPALARPNVEVVAAPIARLTERGVVTADGAERELDAVIYGTGFQVTEMLAPMRVVGRGGRELNAAWRREGIAAHMGTTVAGYPNLFTLMGPNTGLGHNSMVFMIEAQVRYALGCMRAVRERGAAAADVRADAQAAFNAHLQPRLARAVWASGCQSWYLDARGHNATLWPGFTFEFWLRTRRLDVGHYDFLREAGAASRAAATTTTTPNERADLHEAP